MPYIGEHAVRLREPERYQRFRRENDKFGDGIDAIWGITPDGEVELQGLRFDAERYDLDTVREWVQEHEYEPLEIEPARPKESLRRFSTDTAPLEPTDEHDARLLVADDYPDRGLTITEEDLDRIIAHTKQPVPIYLEHKPSLVFGWAGKLWRIGRELWGKLRFRPAAQALLEESPIRGVSVGLAVEPEPHLREVSLTLNPRVPTAQVFHQETDTPQLYIVRRDTMQHEQELTTTQEPTTHEMSALESQLREYRAIAEQAQAQARAAQQLVVKQAVATQVKRWTDTGKLTPAAAAKLTPILLQLAEDADPTAVYEFSVSGASQATLPTLLQQVIEFVESLPSTPQRRPATQYVGLSDAERELARHELERELHMLGFRTNLTPEAVDAVMRNGMSQNGGGH